MLRLTTILRSFRKTTNTDPVLVKNYIPPYITFLAKHLCVPIQLNDNEYITQEEQKQNRENIYQWSQHPFVNCHLPSYEERNNGFVFRKPLTYDDSEKNC